MDDPLQGTGRSMGLMLKAISEALLNRCVWVEFGDHADMTNSSATAWAEVLEMQCAQIGLRFMRIATRGSRVFVVSLAPTKETPESAPTHPECPSLPATQEA